MILSINIKNKKYKIDAANPQNIAIQLRFDDAQPNAYGVEAAIATACEVGEIIGEIDLNEVMEKVKAI
jgi:hypothetical protein